MGGREGETIRWSETIECSSTRVEAASAHKEVFVFSEAKKFFFFGKKNLK